jgi:1-acyl-sn-glycerol-3-phosphate acyltransferase
VSAVGAIAARGGALALRRALRTAAVVVSVAGYSLLAPVGYVTFAGLCWWWKKKPLVCARRLQRCMGWGFRFMHDWLRWVRVADFNHRGALPGLPEGPCIVIANHPTQMDVTAIGACLGGACTIVKSTVYRRRLVRPMLEGAGLLEGPGTDPISVGRVIDDGVQRIRDGMRIFVFPEGSRSPPGRLRPFGRLAFEIACRAGVPLVSVGIRCEPVYLSREVPLFRPPGRLPVLRLSLLAIDDPGAFGNDSRVLREVAEGRFRGFVGIGPGVAAAQAGSGE